MASCVYVCIIIPTLAIVKPIQNGAVINMVNKSRKIPKNLQSIQKSSFSREKWGRKKKEKQKYKQTNEGRQIP